MTAYMDLTTIFREHLDMQCNDEDEEESAATRERIHQMRKAWKDAMSTCPQRIIKLSEGDIWDVLMQCVVSRDQQSPSMLYEELFERVKNRLPEANPVELHHAILEIVDRYVKERDAQFETFERDGRSKFAHELLVEIIEIRLPWLVTESVDWRQRIKNATVFLGQMTRFVRALRLHEDFAWDYHRDMPFEVRMVWRVLNHYLHHHHPCITNVRLHQIDDPEALREYTKKLRDSVLPAGNPDFHRELMASVWKPGRLVNADGSPWMDE